MKFLSEIEIDDEHLKVLLDYQNGYSLDDEYFNLTDKQEIEEEMSWKTGLLDGGFYQHYPLTPTILGQFILEQYNKRIKQSKQSGGGEETLTMDSLRSGTQSYTPMTAGSNPVLTA